jgi:plastocyanin
MPQDVRFACAQHGPLMMKLNLSLEAGAGRIVEVIGGSVVTQWTVKIDGADTGLPDGSTVKVHSGDTITWSVADRTHGVIFANQDLAQAMLQFDTTVGQPLKDQSQLGQDLDWAAFGNKLWGTDPFDAVVTLAKAKVK